MRTRASRASVDGAVIEALTGALRAFALTICSAEVVEAWSTPSVLNGYTVGGIAGHVLGLVRRLEAVLTSGAPEDVTVIRYTDWYGGAATTAAVVQDHRARLVDAGERLAARGAPIVTAELEASSARLAALLPGCAPDRIVPLASIPGAGVRLDEFLSTRIVEVVVHADDIASSVDIAPPPAPELALAITLDVLVEVTAHRQTPLAVIRALSRPDRAGSVGIGPM